jgi:hypothetical protein
VIFASNVHPFELGQLIIRCLELVAPSHNVKRGDTVLNDIDITGTKHGYEESHEQRSSKPTPLIHLETWIT